MIKGFRAVLLFFLSLGAACAAPVKVATWNLQWFPGGHPEARGADKQRHMRAARAAVKILNPDVLCLQEVRDWKAVANLVSDIPGLRPVVVSRFDGDQQQAIVSRLPADSSWSEAWNLSEIPFIPRGYVFAALRMPDGAFLLVYSLHMKANGGPDRAGNILQREAAARQLIRHAEAMKQLYGQRGRVGILLAGDWNTTLDENPEFNAERTIRSFLEAGFKSAWENVPFERRITHPGTGFWPSITFDQILVAGLHSGPGYVVDLPGVSDHLPAVVEISGVTGDFDITVAPQATPPAEAPSEAASPVPAGPMFQVEEDAPGYQVREILPTPPTIMDPFPVRKKEPVP